VLEYCYMGSVPLVAFTLKEISMAGNVNTTTTELFVCNIVEALDLGRLYQLPGLTELLSTSLITVAVDFPAIASLVISKVLRLKFDDIAVAILDKVGEKALSKSAFIGFTEDILCFCLSHLVGNPHCDAILEATVEWGKWMSNSKQLVSLSKILERPLNLVKFDCVSPQLVEGLIESEGIFSDSQLVVVYKNQAKRKLQELEWTQFKVGDMIDCKDFKGYWYESTVLEVKEDSIKVHYNGWSTSWDEWVPRMATDRLAKKGSHTNGPRQMKRRRFTLSNAEALRAAVFGIEATINQDMNF